MNIEIRTFSPAYADDFRRLNEDWITRLFALEEADAAVLNDPQGAIIDAGGEILFALEGSQVLGTCALLRVSASQCEMAKMAVTPAAQGRHVGRLLGEAFVATARQMGFTLAVLETNATLAPALGLYRSLGFVELPMPHASEYSRADVYMELPLD